MKFHPLGGEVDVEPGPHGYFEFLIRTRGGNWAWTPWIVIEKTLDAAWNMASTHGRSGCLDFTDVKPSEASEPSIRSNYAS